MITEENREKASRGEEVLLGRYTCGDCGRSIEHWYVTSEYKRSLRHEKGPYCHSERDDYRTALEEVADQRDSVGEGAACSEYQNLYAMGPIQQAYREERKKQEIARTAQNLAEDKAHLDKHTRCRSMAETIFALDHRIKPEEAMARARVFLDYYDTEEKQLRRCFERAEEEAKAAERL